MVDENTPAGSPPAYAALDAALAVGRTAISGLRRLKNEIVDAQAAAESDLFWPFVLFTMFPRFQRRRRIQKMTAEVQADLAALDAAVAALRAAGVSLPLLGDTQASRARRRDVQVDAVSGPPDAWAGPRHLVEVTLRRVARIDDELRRMREACKTKTADSSEARPEGP